MFIDESHMKLSTIMTRANDRTICRATSVLDDTKVMNIYPSYNILLRRPWIHIVKTLNLLLHQCLKYIMNDMLVTIKAEEIIFMVKNMVVPFIEARDYKDRDIHAFKIINIKWVLENIVLRRPMVLEEMKMITKCFLKHGIPFQHDFDTGMPKMIDLMKVKCAN